MARIFISHSYLDEAIAYKLVNFLLAALSIKEEEIFCSSNPDQGLDYRFTGVPDQLKERLNKSEALIVLITADSLHSAWIPFEVGTFWTTDKPVIPILGPGLIHDDLPGPLRSLLSIPIDAKDWSDKVNNAINQLVAQLKIEQKVRKRRNDTLQEFFVALKAWQSQRTAAPESQQEIEQLKAQIQELEQELSKARSQVEQLKEKEQGFKYQIKELEQKLEKWRSQLEQVQESERSYNEQRQKNGNLERSLKLRIEKLEKERLHNQEKEKLEQSLKSKIEQLKKELEEARSQVAQVQESERSHKQQLEGKIKELEKERSQKDYEIMRLREKLVERSQNQVQSVQVQSFAEHLGFRLKLEMVVIPGGKFMMGSPEGEGHYTEYPQHEVTIKPFLIGKYPVTQAQYEKVMEENPSKFTGNNRRPVESVTWDEAVDFCRRISEKTGKEYRLPSEAEWEYACRAGTTTQYYFGDVNTDKLSNNNSNIGMTTVVGKYPPNSFGLYDMHGNVQEWCQDDWYYDYVHAPNDGSAWLSDENTQKVKRGGSWRTIPSYCRSAYRDGSNPVISYYGHGFRVACGGARI